METMETVAVTLRMLMMAMQALMTLMQTLMTLMQTLLILLLYLLRPTTKVLGKKGNDVDKQIWVSAYVCVVIFMHVKTRGQQLNNLEFNRNRCVITWLRRRR